MLAKFEKAPRIYALRYTPKIFIADAASGLIYRITSQASALTPIDSRHRSSLDARADGRD